jgi:hypothetical protein
MLASAAVSWAVSWRELLDLHDELASQLVDEAGGRVVKGGS